MSQSSDPAKSRDADVRGSDSELKGQAQSKTTENDGEVTRVRSEPVTTDQNEPSQRPAASKSEPSTAGPSRDTPDPGQDSQEKENVTSSARRVIAWTLTNFFDWNPKYLLQLRGIFNILHVIMGLIVIIMLGVNCQLHTFPNGPSEGFFCQPPETFLFVTSIAAFLTSLLYLFCCLLSRKTEALLFETSFEISYYVLYFVLLLTSSSALLVSAVSWGSERMMYGNDYNLTHTAAVLGLINSIAYGTSAVSFYISQRYHFHSTQSLPTA